ncbi:unnamed protein product, partial [marine sediment metagenome]
TAEEIAGLPGIGLATAEKMIISAKEFKPAAKIPTAKKPAVKAEEKAIPKPKVPKAAPAVTVKKTEPRPSVKEPVAKAPVTRKPPVAKKPSAAKKPVTKKTAVKVTSTVSEATKKAIEKATHTFTIKQKRTKKTKPKKLAKLSSTYGIVNCIVHDGAGKSKNRAVIMKLYETEIPIEKYLGRKVKVNLPKSEKHLVGTITKVHGKRASRDNTVVVHFSKGVSPHIITARGIVL